MRALLMVTALAVSMACDPSPKSNCVLDTDCLERQSCDVVDEAKQCVCLVGVGGAVCAQDTDCPGGTCTEGCECIEERMDASQDAGETADAASDDADTMGCMEVVETTDSNDGHTEAQDIGEIPLEGSACISGSCTDLDADFFRFSTPVQAHLVGVPLACENLEDLTGIEFFDAAGNYINGATDSGCATESWLLDASPGTYFARIACDPGASGTYRVRLSLTAD